MSEYTSKAPTLLHKPDLGIVGGGVAGLNTGIEALKQGHRNVRIYEAQTYNPDIVRYPGSQLTTKRTSDAAIAQFFPYVEGGLTSEDQAEHVLWIQEALDSYIERMAVDEYSRVMAPRHNIELMKDPEPIPEYLKKALGRFGSVKEFGGIPKNPLGFSYGYDFTTLAFNSPGMVRALAKEFKELGGNIVTQAVQDPDQFYSLPEQILVDCMGLGARDIFPELGLEAVKGNLMFFEGPKGTKHGFNTIVSAEDLIVLPRTDNILAVGAGYFHTFNKEVPTDEELSSVNSRISQLLDIDIQEFRGLSDKLAHSELAGMTSGFRPYRKEGVLIAAQAGPDNKTVIHNVGHSGMGWTLAGTGKAAVRLINSI